MTKNGRVSGSPLSRRQFTLGLAAAGGLTLLSRSAPAAVIELRQFHNQPGDSPLHKSLVDMWAAVKTETGGRVQVQTFPENDNLPGGDPVALSMLVDGHLDFLTLNGGLIGSVVPAVNVGRDHATNGDELGPGGHRHEPAAWQEQAVDVAQRQPRLGPHQPGLRVERQDPVCQQGRGDPMVARGRQGRITS